MNYSAGRSTLLAEEIRVELTRQRKPIKLLAEEAGFTISTLRRRLDGSSAFTLDELVRVADALGLSVTDLIDRIAVSA